MDQGQHGKHPIFGNLGLTGRKFGALFFYCVTLWLVSSNPGWSLMYCAIGGVIPVIIFRWLKVPNPEGGGLLLFLVPLATITSFPEMLGELFSPMCAFFSSMIATAFLPLRQSIQTSWWVDTSGKEITEWKVFKFSDHRVFYYPHTFPNAQKVRYLRRNIHPRYKARIEVKVEIAGSNWEDLWNAAEVCAWSIRDDEKRYIIGFDPDPSDPTTLNLRTANEDEIPDPVS
jgi:hypothetical protein